MVVAVMVSLVMSPVLAIENVAVSRLFGSKAVLEIDGKRRVLTAGDQSPEGVRLIAVEGDTVSVEFDGKRERITLGCEISGGAAGYVIPLPS